MQLHFLGTAGYHPSETRHTSCYYLPESGILLDAGTGMFRLPSLLQTNNLDILLSHTHLDHIVGLTFLFDILYQRPVESVRVWGEGEKLAAARALLGNDYIFPVELPVTWHAIDDADGELSSPLLIGGAEVTWRHQTHPGGSVAYRIDWPDTHPATKSAEAGAIGQSRSLVYATDTAGASEQPILQWMHGVDVLLHECNFHDHQREWAEKTGHCYLNRVAEISAATAPKRVLLTHINPIDELILESNDPRFKMPCEIVSDGLVVEF
jgi:ribonuclease BN (tRNA processing enzyme)